VKNILRLWRWKVLHHPPYSPDLLSCDYDLIPKLKQPLREKRLRTREDISNTVQREMARFGDGEADGICRLPRRSRRVLDILGDYFEGY
ncbi:hypothetical protein L798_15109, partial [Zootermopsis nevadensis]